MNKYINFLDCKDGRLDYNYRDSTAILPFKLLLDSSIEYFCNQKNIEVFNSDNFYKDVLGKLMSKQSYIVDVNGKYYSISDIILGYLSTVDLSEDIHKSDIELFLNKELLIYVRSETLTEKQLQGILFNFLLINQFTKFYILDLLDVKIKDSVISGIGFRLNSITTTILNELNEYLKNKQEDL